MQVSGSMNQGTWTKEHKRELWAKIRNGTLSAIDTNEPNLQKIVDKKGTLVCYLCSLCKTIFASRTGSPRYIHVRSCREKYQKAELLNDGKDSFDGNSGSSHTVLNGESDSPEFNDPKEAYNGNVESWDNIQQMLSTFNPSSTSRKRGFDSYFNNDIYAEEAPAEKRSHSVDHDRLEENSQRIEQLTQIVNMQTASINNLRDSIVNISNKFDSFMDLLEHHMGSSMLPLSVEEDEQQFSSKSFASVNGGIPDIKASSSCPSSLPSSAAFIPGIATNIDRISPPPQYIAQEKILDCLYKSNGEDKTFIFLVAENLMTVFDFLSRCHDVPSAKEMELRRIVCQVTGASNTADIIKKEDIVNSVLNSKKKSWKNRFRAAAKASPIEFSVGTNERIVVPIIHEKGLYIPMDPQCKYKHFYDNDGTLLSTFPAISKTDDGLNEIKQLIICEKIQSDFTFSILSFEDYQVRGFGEIASDTVTFDL